MVGTKLSYTIPEAVNASGIGRTKLYEYIRSGELQTRKAGRRTIITHPALEKLVNNLPEGRVK